jgi:hypothetical protein
MSLAENLSPNAARITGQKRTLSQVEMTQFNAIIDELDVEGASTCLLDMLNLCPTAMFPLQLVFQLIPGALS